jgi:hypothetical protein
MVVAVLQAKQMCLCEAAQDLEVFHLREQELYQQL